MKVRPASRRAASLPRSAIREIMSLAAGKPDVIHLEVGEPDASTPAHITDAAFKAAREGWTRYSSNAGLPSLRAKVAGRVSGRWKTDVPENRVVITTGAVGGLYSALMSVLDPGDELLIPDPGWPNYEAIGHLRRDVRALSPFSRHRVLAGPGRNQAADYAQDQGDPDQHAGQSDRRGVSARAHASPPRPRPRNRHLYGERRGVLRYGVRG